MKKARRISMTAFASAVFAATMAGSAYAEPLQPVQHADWMAQKSIISAGQNGDLALERNITLAEASVVFARLKQAKLEAAPQGAHWSAPYLNWAKAQGAVSDAEAANPSKPVSSAELAAFAGKLGYDLKLEETAQVTRGDFFQALGDALTTQITIAHTNDVHGHILEDAGQRSLGTPKLPRC
jgi:5'-nucleotidase